MGAGWKRMKVGWETVLRSGRLCMGGITGRNGQTGLCLGLGQNGSTSIDVHTILTYVVHRLVVEKDVSAASPRGKVYIVGAALRGNVQKPPKVWIYGKDKIVLGPLFLFLVMDSCSCSDLKKALKF
ncbi:hypothetical protein V6N11_020319 [Hibiscus sabdariffa]|uniref:Uncharacterized protein n=1 Tax=Hibiscus sabdariffa TaxID=183260 RepID=A0ABR2Q830_9ROSI